MLYTTQIETKRAELETVFEQIDRKPIYKNQKEATGKKLSNLILIALQEDKKRIDCWDAFVKFSWDKSF